MTQEGQMPSGTRRRALQLAAGLTGTVGVVGLAACGGSTAERPSGESAAPVTVSFTSDWDSNAVRGETMKQAMALFAQRYPKIAINKTDLAGAKAQIVFATTLAAGTYDDVILLGAPEAPRYAAQGTFVDLAPYLKTAKVDLKSFVYVEPAHTIGTKRFFLPFQQSASVWYVNKTLFQKEGVPLPNASWTWNDWVDAGKRLAKPDDNQYAFGPALDDDLKSKFLPVIGSNGGHHISADFKKSMLTNPSTLEAIRWAADRIQRDRSWAPPGTKADFSAGNIGMFTNSGGGIGDNITKIAGKFEWDVMPQPKAPRTGKSLRTFSNQPHGITTKSNGGTARIEAAFTFVLFLSGREVQTLVAKGKGSVPALRELLTSPP